MKVYVDTSKLESHDIQSITDLGGKEFKQVRLWFEDTDNVEIQSLSDYTKQVRKDVCEEIGKKLPDFIYNFQEPETPRTKVIEIEDIKYILDQIQGETK